ncbi:MAG: hypothetical protein AAAB35_12955 [Phyllobacterium sp.]|uniref:hypothetical protein n=1 Tax=Phyllobacterium sp. TaxID=1871046 RepID=UPI0030F2FE9A
MKRALVMTFAFSIGSALLAGCNGSDSKESETSSSSFTELNAQVAKLGDTLKQGQGVIDQQTKKIDEQNRKIAQSEETATARLAETQALRTELAAVQETLTDIKQQSDASVKFDPQALQKNLDALQQRIDAAPKSQLIEAIDAAVKDLRSKLLDSASFDRVATEVAKLTELLKGIDATTLASLTDTLAALRKDIDAIDPAGVKSIRERLKVLEDALKGTDSTTLGSLKDALAALRKDIDAKPTLDPTAIRSLGDRLKVVEEQLKIINPQFASACSDPELDDADAVTAALDSPASSLPAKFPPLVPLPAHGQTSGKSAGHPNVIDHNPD